MNRDDETKKTATEVGSINQEWDGNTVLRQKGVFRLKEVCRNLPFKPSQIISQIKNDPEAEEHVGVWLDPETGIYLVDMSLFSPWVQELMTGKIPYRQP